jgi:hypothetical protein
MVFYMIILVIKSSQYISSTYEAMTEIKLTKILSFVEYKNMIFLFVFFPEQFTVFV